MTNSGRLDFDLAQMTSTEVIEQFRNELTYGEALEILDFELDGPNTLSMIYAALSERKFSQSKLDELMARFDPLQPD